MRWAGTTTTILDCDKGAADPVVFTVQLVNPIEGAQLAALVQEPARAAVSSGEPIGSPEVTGRLKQAEVSAYANYIPEINGPLPNQQRHAEGKAQVEAVLLQMVAWDFAELANKIQGAQAVTPIEGKVSVSQS